MPSSGVQPLLHDDLTTAATAAMVKTGSSTPCSKLPSNYDFVSSKHFADVRRKALADLPGNGSPVCGLIPSLSGAETPSNLKSALKSCRAICPQGENSIDLASTPLGENLLRSQVQLLLQKVEANVPANKQCPSLRSLCVMHTFSESPGLRLVAPTPLNTPCAAIPSTESISKSNSDSAQPLYSHCLDLQRNPSSIGIDRVSQPKLRDVPASVVNPLVDLNVSPRGSESFSVSDVESCLKQPHIKIAESITSGNDHHVVQLKPLIADQNELASAELVLGTSATRILQFGSPEKILHSPSHEPDDDEVSDWSVLVNVSSPAGKDDSLHQYVETDVTTASVSSIDIHLKRNHCNQEDEDKVNFLWSDRRKLLQDSIQSVASLASEQDPCEEDYSEEAWEEDHEAYGSTDHSDLCDNFSHMTMEKKPLPQGEGKHIRFVYESDDDEIKEEVVETRTRNNQLTDGLLLRGLPAPAGKHVRFCDADDGQES